MSTDVFTESVVLLFVLLNPFLLSVYLLDLVHDLDRRHFGGLMLGAGIISVCVFVVFAGAGDLIFSGLLGVRFAALLIFGGLVFLVVAMRFALMGGEAIRTLRGPAQPMAGSIAMPFMIGPGTVSASIIAGHQLSLAHATLAIAMAVATTVVLVMAIKILYDFVRQRHEPVIERYTDIVGRIFSLIVGSLAIEMIMDGVDSWLTRGGS